MEIHIQGIIGAGKTTVLKKMSSKIEESGKKTGIIWEPIDKWQKNGILKLFGSNNKRWSFLFQLISLLDKTEETEEYEEMRRSCDVILRERSLASDQCFINTLVHQGNMTRRQEENYYRIRKHFTKVEPDVVLYVKTGVKTCGSRIAARNRDGESKISSDYQTLLSNEHDNVFGDLDNTVLFDNSGDLTDKKIDKLISDVGISIEV